MNASYCIPNHGRTKRLRTRNSPRKIHGSKSQRIAVTRMSVLCVRLEWEMWNVYVLSKLWSITTDNRRSTPRETLQGNDSPKWNRLAVRPCWPLPFERVWSMSYISQYSWFSVCSKKIVRLVSLKSSTPSFAGAPCSSHLERSGEQDGCVASVSIHGIGEKVVWCWAMVEEWSVQVGSETCVLTDLLPALKCFSSVLVRKENK